jgi:protein SCO1
VIEKLGTQLDLALPLRDESGKNVVLGDYLKSGAPLILTLNYFSCETLCSLQLGGFAKSLSEMGSNQLQDLRIVTVSFDPSDTPERASAKKEHFLSMIEGDTKPRWDFLVANPNTIQKVTSALGFQYRFDEETNQFAHTAAIFFLSPLGVVSRYLYGIEFSPRDIRFAWIDASEGKFGTNIERLMLRCFHYDSSTGKYTPFAMNVVRWSGVVTVLLLAGALGLLWRKDIRGIAGGLDSAV